MYLSCLHVLGPLCVVILLSVLPIECVDRLFGRLVHRSANIHRNRMTKQNHVRKSKLMDVIYKNQEDKPLQISNDVTLIQKNILQEIVYTTTHKYSGYAREYKNRHVGDISLALTQNREEKSSIDMVLPIAGTLTVLFSMGLLIALFQCCCRKRQTSDTEDVKSREDKPVDSRKDSVNEEPKVEEKPTNDIQGSNDGVPVSIRSKIKQFEGVIPTQPSPGPIRPTKKRPESNAFKALENKGIVYGMGKSPSRLSKTPEDENQNATLTQEETKPEEEEPKHNDDLSGYKQPENPDVVIADFDEDDEFGAIKRDTSVLRSYKKAPPPKNRNRSSAAVRRKRARETTTDLLFNDSSDNSFLNVPGDLEVVYGNDKTEEIQNNSTERSKNKSNKSDSMDKSKNKKDKNNSSERNKNNKDKKKTETEAPPSIVTSDHSSDSIIEINKQEVPPEVFSGNIFMQIDPTVKNKNVGKTEQKTETPPPTRLRTSQLSVEERKEKAKSTPLLSSHEDLAKALGRLKSPSKENNSQKTAGKNRSSSDLSSNTKL